MIEIACSADTPYLPHVSVMLRSLLVHTRQRPLRIWLTHGTELSGDGCARLEAVVTELGATLEYVPVPEGMMTGFSKKKFHPACWYRILLPELLPQIDRLIYLDCDTIVTDDLLPLWETELNDKLFGAVCNPLFPLMRNWPKQDLGIEDPLEYLNSGVLLMNLAAMRKEGLIEKLRVYSTEYPDRLLPEQDALSDLTRGRWVRLHPRWNMQTTLYDLPAFLLPYPKKVVQEALAKPAIIHYNGPFKPWQYLCKHPLRDLYFQHLEGTPWPKQPLVKASLVFRLIRPLPLSLQYAIFGLRPIWRAIRSAVRHWFAIMRSVTH